MTRKLTLFLVCAFEIALILFVVAWTAFAADGAKYKCDRWHRTNTETKLSEFEKTFIPDTKGKDHILEVYPKVVHIIDSDGERLQLEQAGLHNKLWQMYRSSFADWGGSHRFFWIKKDGIKIEVHSVHPKADSEYVSKCHKI